MKSRLLRPTASGPGYCPDRGLLAVCKIHFAPTQNRDLVMRSANFQGFPLGLGAVALVDVVDAVGVPHAAVTAVSLDCVDGLAGAGGFDALGGNLPAGLVGGALTALESQAVVLFEVQNGANVNHFCFPLSFLSD